MEFFINAFNVLLHQPLFNGLILLYQYLPGHDFGIAVIVLTVLIRIILYPLANQGIKSQKTLQELQPKIKEIQEKFKGKEAQARAMMEFYQKQKINPFSGCLPLLVQIPILFALFRVFWKGFEPQQFKFLYSFVPHPGAINTSFLGLMNLSHPSFILALITGIGQFFQTKMTSPPQKKAPKGDFSQMLQKQMLYFFPVFTVFILWRLPSAIALYWLISTLFTIGQQYFILKKHD